MTGNDVRNGFEYTVQIAKKIADQVPTGKGYQVRMMGGTLLLDFCSAIVLEAKIMNEWDTRWQMDSSAALKELFKKEDNEEICGIYEKYSGQKKPLMVSVVRNDAVYIFDRRNLFAHEMGTVLGYNDNKSDMTDTQITAVHFLYTKLFKLWGVEPKISVDEFVKLFIKYMRWITPGCRRV